MADKWPLANGNWSNAANWNDGTKPVAGDDVYADNRTVTIDEDVNIGSGTLRTSQRSGGTNGGSFSVTSSGRTITANITTNSTTTLSYSGTGTLTFNGNVTPTGNDGINNSGTGTVNINGNVTGASPAANAYGVRNSSTGTINVIGNVTGGAGSGAYGLTNTSTGTISITGNVLGGSNSNTIGVHNNSGGSVTINGNMTGGSGGTSYGAFNGSTGSLIITGNATGGSGSNAHGAVNASTGLLRVYGIAIGNDHGLGYVSNNGTVGVSGFGINTGVVQATTTVRGIRYGAKGQSPTAGLVQLDTTDLANSYAKFRTAPTSFTEYTFGPPENIGDQPAANNVRLGTVYNFGNTTGTCAVPPASSVAYGVPVDNTTGTAVITEAGLSALFEAALQPNAPMIVERSTNDTKAITFSWPVNGATITGQKSIDNNAYNAVTGAITFLRTESNRHYYALAYNAADRNTVESSIRYKMTDGTYTKYFNLHVVPSGDVEVVVTPLQATAPDRITPTAIETLINDTSAIGPVAITDSSGDPVSLSGLTLKVCIERIDGTVLANLTPTISGGSNNQITFTPNADSVAKTGTFRWALRQVSDGKVYGLGEFIVDSAAKIAP